QRAHRDDRPHGPGRPAGRRLDQARAVHRRRPRRPRRAADGQSPARGQRAVHDHHGHQDALHRPRLATTVQPELEERVCIAMQTSPRWPIGTWGALWLAFLLIIGHYVAMFGVGGVLTIALGIHDRREIWQAPPAAFIINIGVGLFEIGVVLRLGMCRYARLSFREAGWRGLAPRDVPYGVLGFVLFAIVVTCVFAAE